MATVTAQMVNSLRQRTGISMMDCKNALKEADGDEDQVRELIELARNHSGVFDTLSNPVPVQVEMAMD